MKISIKILFLSTLLFNSIFCENLKFLENDNALSFKYDNYLTYFNGFLNGTGIFKIAPNIEGCDLSNEGFINSINDFSFYIKNETWKHQNVVEVIQDVSASFGYFFGNFSKIFRFCKNTPKETIELLKALGKYLSSPFVYIGNVMKTAISNPYYIYREYIRSRIFLEENNSYEAGQTVGKLVNLVFFPKIDNTLILLYKESKNQGYTEIENLFQCGIKNLEVAKNVLNAVTEFIRIFRKTGSFSNLKSQLTNIVKNESDSISQCLKLV